ncbi:MAG: redoxin domain-containing protein [Bacteroidota bacterium]
MKPVIPMRFRPICLIIAILALTTSVSTGQNYVVFDSIDQLQSYIEREKDATVVINFWATWCKPCVEELPIYEELNKMYDDQYLNVILVSLDFKSQLERKFVPFLKSRSLESEVVMLADQDVDTWIPTFDDMWDGALPATLVLNGKQRIFVTGAFSSVGELKQVVDSLKAESPRFSSPVTCGSKLAGQ